MYFKIKTSRKIVTEQGKEKDLIETYLTDALHFADAGYKIIKAIGTDVDIESVTMMKTFKPAVNDKYSEDNKLFIVKIAEDSMKLILRQINAKNKNMPITIEHINIDTELIQRETTS